MVEKPLKASRRSREDILKNVSDCLYLILFMNLCLRREQNLKQSQKENPRVIVQVSVCFPVQYVCITSDFSV